MTILELSRHCYYRDVFVIVRPSRDLSGRLITSLIIRNYRDGESLSTQLREGDSGRSMTDVRQKLGYLAKLVRVCEIDPDHPTDQRYVPMRVTWDIRLDDADVSVEG
jgi:hypothetical protein